MDEKLPEVAESLTQATQVVSSCDSTNMKDERAANICDALVNSPIVCAASHTSTGKGGTGSKQNTDRKSSVNFDEKIKIENNLNATELLGSVTTHNCPGTRTSARVIQKMKQDQSRPISPPPNEREPRKDDKVEKQKTLAQVRANKSTWTNLERNHFFDALNEFGKDFDSIGNYINAKLKRKSTVDVSFKTKDQVRQHYYHTYHQICKYIKFSDEIKKPAQELYGLINYGEMRRKLQFVSDKHFMKLKNLVYQGHLTVRCKGKNIRIKTPSCKALRRLNQLDDSLEDIRLPSKIEVIVSPANMESFGRVQMLAQNPRARTTVPLHKKLVNFIKTFQYKWRSPEMKLAEEEAKLFPPTPSQLPLTEQCGTNGVVSDAQAEKPLGYMDAEMCFLPKPGVTIHRPLLSITEYLSSVNICLTAYEERMGVKVRGETLCQDRSTATKRQRTDSNSEKKSPEMKKSKPMYSHVAQEKVDADVCTESATIATQDDPVISQDTETLNPKSESSSDELSDEIHDLLAENDTLVVKEDATTSGIASNSSNNNNNSNIGPSTNSSRSKRSSNTKSIRSALSFKPLISDDILKRIRCGWTISNAADITIGDLYVVLGQDSKLELEYYWTDALSQPAAAAPTTVDNVGAPNETTLCSVQPDSTVANSTFFTQKQNGMPYNPNECDDVNLLKALSTSALGNKLRHLLLIANLSERIRKRQCSCGHTCDRNTAKSKIERDLAAKTFISPKTFSSNIVTESNGIFRQPIVPIRRPSSNMDVVKQQLPSQIARPRMNRQVLVQRLLLPGTSNHSYDLLDVKNLQNNLSDIKVNPRLPTTTITTTTTLQPTSCLSETTFNNSIDNNTTQCISSSMSASIQNSSTSLNDCNSASIDDTLNALPCSATASSSSLESNSNLDLDLMTPNTTIITNQEDLNQCIAETSIPSVPDSAFDDCSNNSIFNSMSPMHLIRDSNSNSRWLEENLNDFSLTSLLGHLDEINASRDILDPASNLSVLSESSVDYMHKFQEITALMQSQDKD